MQHAFRYLGGGCNSKVLIIVAQICKDEQHLRWHHLHLTDGNNVRCFIAVHARSNDGSQQASIDLTKRGNSFIRVVTRQYVGGFRGNAIIGVSKQWQCNANGKRLSKESIFNIFINNIMINNLITINLSFHLPFAQFGFCKLALTSHCLSFGIWKFGFAVCSFCFQPLLLLVLLIVLNYQALESWA